MPVQIAFLTGLCAALTLLSAAAGAVDCIEDGPCSIAEGSYHYAMPLDGSAAMPVIVHFHGYGSSGAAALRNAPVVEAATARGYIFVALDGTPGPLAPQRNDWSVRDGTPPWRDEAGFARAVLEDLAQRHAVDRNRVLMTGFSRGGSMVWDIACHDPTGFAAFAPASGAFWRPLPETCSGPVKLLHHHGWSDKVVPIEGRQIPGLPIRQGDVFAGMGVLREAAGLGDDLPQSFSFEGDTLCRLWMDEALRLCLHPGGHSPPPGWMDQVLDWFERQAPAG